MAIIRFPILEELQSSNDDVLGIKMAKKQRKVLTALFKIVVPFGDDPEEYAFGTTSRIAPYYTSMLTAYHKVMVMLNQLINRYLKPLQLKVKPFPLYDLAIIEEFPKVYNLVPPLNGNIGGRDEETPETPEVAAPQQTQPATVTATPQLTRASTTPEPTKSANGTVSMAEFMNAQNPQPQMGQGMMMPQMGMAPNGMMPNMNGGMMMGIQPQQPMMGNMNTGFTVNAPIPHWMQNNNMQMGQMQQQVNPFMQAVSGMRQGQAGLGLM